jgi:hypothetical protein
MTCDKCGYDGKEGWNPSEVDQDPMGNYINGWFCPECGEQVCTEGDDCPPDEFGQTG